MVKNMFSNVKQRFNQYNCFKKYLSANSTIIASELSRNFQDAVVKVLDKNEDTLAAAEARSIAVFRKNAPRAVNADVAGLSCIV
jgi:hypothetical protein